MANIYLRGSRELEGDDDDDDDDDDGGDDDGGDGVKPVVALLETTRSTRASVHEGKAGQCSLN